MLFIEHGSNSKSAKDYFTEHLSRSDYYQRDAQEVLGAWHGRGAELLGLSGQVDKETYFRLCENLHPGTGAPLTARTRADRRVIYDFTFNSPKSVTLAYELGGDERVLDAFRAAVRETMADIEVAMQARVRKRGVSESRETENIIWGEFLHRTTRPVDGVPDPSLHTHAVAINATYDPVESCWKAGEFQQIFRDKGFYQSVFHSRLSGKLAALGYGIERDGNSFRIAGIDRATCELFSRRSKIIEQEANRRGINTPRGKRDLGRQTREAKPERQMTMTELREEWLSRLTGDDRTAITEARAGQETGSLDADAAVKYALAHSFERNSAITEKNLLKTALIQSFGKASVEDVQGIAAKRADILRGNYRGQRYATTREVLREERDIVNFVRSGKATREKLGGSGPIKLDPFLSEEQRNAALVILNSRDRATALKGGAGTGKTRMMQSTVTAIERTGKKVFTFAPSAEASRGVLRSEGFANAETVERLLIDPEMQARVNGQVLWVDEAGLLSVKDMKRLFDVANAQNARIVLSGDSSQHNAVLRGDALRILEKDAGMKTGVLKKIRRQTDATYRDAVSAIAEGDRVGSDGRTRFVAGMEMLDRSGAIIETNGEHRYRQIARDYASAISERKGGGETKSALVVSPTHREADHVTQAIRVVLKESGKISEKDRAFSVLRPLNFTEAERGIAANYAPGEVIQFHQNAQGFKRGERVTVADAASAGVTVTRPNGSKTQLPLSDAKKFQLYRREALALSQGDKLRITQNGFTRGAQRGIPGDKGDRLNNGAVYEIDSFTKEGDIRLRNGFVVPKDYGGLAHGYATTSHSAQGKTVDKVFIALGSESFTAANREQLYVSASRGREAIRLYTDDKSAMMEAVQASSARLSATELMGANANAPPSNRKIRDRLPKPHNVKRLYNRLRERIAAQDFVKAYRKQHEFLSHGKH